MAKLATRSTSGLTSVIIQSMRSSFPTPRWSGMDSNFQYAEAVSCSWALFLASIAWDGSARRSGFYG